MIDIRQNGTKCLIGQFNITPTSTKQCCKRNIEMSCVHASHMYQGLDNLWLRHGVVENKAGQQPATIRPVFSAMLLSEDCVQNVSDVSE